MARLPSLFVSHGAPTFALEPGRAGPALTALGRTLPRPEAVLVVSPHWTTPSPRVGLAAQPQTIHDFGGFDPALYRIEYPARGHPALAGKALDALIAAGWAAMADERRGLDHGAWVPLLHLYPQAEVPVFQVALPSRLDAESAWAFGQALTPLADDGVLIVGSGSLTHNLGDFRGGHGAELPYATYTPSRAGCARPWPPATARGCAVRWTRHRRPRAPTPRPSTSGRCWWPPARHRPGSRGAWLTAASPTACWRWTPSSSATPVGHPHPEGRPARPAPGNGLPPERHPLRWRFIQPRANLRVRS